MKTVRVMVSDADDGEALLVRGRVADGFWSRLIGLIGTKSLEDGHGLLIYPCSSIHTFFMSIPIDVVYVADDHRVVGIDRAVRPWRIGTMQRGVRYVIEVRAGAAASVCPGDVLHLEGWQPRNLWQKAKALFER